MTTVSVPVIRNEADLEEALARVDALWGAEIGTLEGDEFDVLTTLVHDFESRHFPMEPPTPIEAVTALIDRLELSRKDLLPIFGTAGRLSEFLNGKRNLSKAQIKALHETYRIPYDSLMG